MAEQALEIKDFSGGITDNYIGGAINKFQSLTNMVLRSDNKAESRPGGIIFDATYNQLPGGSTKRGDSTYRFKDTNIFQQQNKLYHINAGFVEITGPTGSNPAFTTSTVQYDQCSYAEWNNHLLVTSDRRERPKFIYKDGSNMRLRSIGLPAVDTSLITFSAGVGALREYAFCYAYTYTIDGVEHIQRGPVAYKEYTGAITNNITVLPVLANGATGCYDTAVIKLEIYRTADADVTHYKVGEVTNGVVIFDDAVADADLDDGILLYQDAEDLDYTQPPECKFLAQLNGCVYYGNIKDSASDIFPNRIIQSAPDQIYAANEAFQTDVDGDITGLGVAGQVMVVFTANSTTRLDGVYDSTGRGGSFKSEVSRTVGCVNHKSIVQTQEGIFFAAKDGFYFTDGYKVMRISEDINTSYAESVANATMQKRIYGQHDAVNKRIYWTACSDSDVTEVDILFVAHLYWGLKPDTPFTVWDGGHWATNFAPTSLLFYDNMLVTTDKRGYLLKYAEEQLNDVKIDTAVADESLWTFLPVVYDIRTAATDFGDVTRRKWVPTVTVNADPVSRAAFTISSNNDNSGVFAELAEIKSNQPVLWGDTPEPLWGDTNIRWNYIPIITGRRRFPANNLRCSYKQLKITNAYTVVDSTTLSGTVAVDGTANTVTLNTAGFSWDTHAVDYYISFSDDDYASEYKVTARTSDTVITVEDTSGTLPTNATATFKLRGYRKTEALRLLSISIIYQVTTPTQTPYRAS
jgi:hypothetical protein